MTRKPLDDNQLDLFDTGPRKSPYPKILYTADRPGSGPNGETCKSCRWSRKKTGVAGVYLKCFHPSVKTHTNGPGSDIKARWPACSAWEPKPDGE